MFDTIQAKNLFEIYFSTTGMYIGYGLEIILASLAGLIVLGFAIRKSMRYVTGKGWSPDSGDFGAGHQYWRQKQIEEDYKDIYDFKNNRFR